MHLNFCHAITEFADVRKKLDGNSATKPGDGNTVATSRATMTPASDADKLTSKHSISTAAKLNGVSTLCVQGNFEFWTGDVSLECFHY